MRVYGGFEILWLLLAVVIGWLGLILGSATAVALLHSYWVGVVRGVVLTGACVLGVGYTYTRATLPPLLRL